jgi:hypothetical protein
MIDWQSFDWQSFATLATGILAVGAAVTIGLRQSGITVQQNKILLMQATLAETNLKHDLFEKRYQVYDATRSFLLFIIQHADFPDQEHQTAFLRAKHEAKFLFRKDVQDFLQNIWEQSGNLRVLKLEMNKTFELEGHYGDGNPSREYELFEYFNERFNEIVDKFGHEMKLSYVD